MKKLGILLGIGLILTLLFGHARNEAIAAKNKDAVVNNTGAETIVEKING